MAQERSDLLSSHRPGFSAASVGATSSFSPATRLSHTPTATDFQPPYFPPPYNIPQPQSQLDFHHPHVNTDPYAHLNPIHPQAQHQYMHPQQRSQHMLRSGRDETDHLNLHHPGMQLPPSRDYSGVRRPDVLVHGGPHGLGPEQTDLAMLHHPTGLHGVDDTTVWLNRVTNFLHAVRPCTHAKMMCPYSERGEFVYPGVLCYMPSVQFHCTVEQAVDHDAQAES